MQYKVEVLNQTSTDFKAQSWNMFSFAANEPKDFVLFSEMNLMGGEL